MRCVTYSRRDIAEDSTCSTDPITLSPTITFQLYDMASTKTSNFNIWICLYNWLLLTVWNIMQVTNVELNNANFITDYRVYEPKFVRCHLFIWLKARQNRSKKIDKKVRHVDQFYRYSTKLGQTSSHILPVTSVELTGATCEYYAACADKVFELQAVISRAGSSILLSFSLP